MTYNRAHLYLEARVAKEPELHISKNNLAILKLSLAQSERKYDEATKTWKDGDTSWYEATAFGEKAELYATLPRGTLICLEGSFKMRYWEKADGTRGSAFEILIEHLSIPVISEKTFFPEPDGTMVFRRSTRQPKEPPVNNGIELLADESPF